MCPLRRHAQLVRDRLGIKRPSDLLTFDFLKFWRYSLGLYDVNLERLGRYDSNRRNGSRRVKPQLVQWVGNYQCNLDRRRGYVLYQLLSCVDDAR